VYTSLKLVFFEISETTPTSENLSFDNVITILAKLAGDGLRFTWRESRLPLNNEQETANRART